MIQSKGTMIQHRFVKLSWCRIWGSYIPPTTSNLHTFIQSSMHHSSHIPVIKQYTKRLQSQITKSILSLLSSWLPFQYTDSIKHRSTFTVRNSDTYTSDPDNNPRSNYRLQRGIHNKSNHPTYRGKLSVEKIDTASIYTLYWCMRLTIIGS